MEQKRRYNILVTGACGFIGWNFIRRLYETDKISFNRVINMDKMDYSAINPTHEPYYDNRYIFVRGDIKYNSFSIIPKYKIDLVINFAAQTHVDNSIKSSYSFIENNIVGMHMLMEECRKYWTQKGIQGKFININTDEVFGSVEDNGGQPFTDKTPFKPNNPYSASKASAQLLLNSYVNTYNFPGLSTNCSNNYGPGQHHEKLIPKIIKNYLDKESVPVYGDGLQSRDWIYVDDHCDGVIDAILKGESGQSYLFGTNKIIPNIELVKTIQNILESKNIPGRAGIQYVPDRPGHDRTYRIDYTSSTERLGWKPSTELYNGLEKTIDWYLNKVNE